MANPTPTRPDPEMTLPSVVASLARSGAATDVVLTVIFHPEASLIGYRTRVPARARGAPWVLGRRSPRFFPNDGGPPSVLDDRHVSRRAVQFTLRDGRLTLKRFENASRCRVDGAELFDSLEIRSDRLHRGVAMLLGHSIVLLLRSAPPAGPAAGVSPEESCLRGSSAAMVVVRQQIDRAARCDLDVLILGETGTGKELVANAIHRASQRSGGPMISVNMAAIPGDLAPAVLFGCARGAYTGAERAVPGFFELAEQGSLFLDEIGDASLSIQTQLLRALQQGEIQRVGGPVERVDVRVISATETDLEGSECDFRAALRHRLGACQIDLPPLRKRPEDIGELMRYFFERTADHCERTISLPNRDAPATEIAAWALLFLAFLDYDWPGNVRELQNCVRQVTLTGEGRPEVPDRLQAARIAVTRSAALSPQPRRLQEVDEETFDKVMAANGFEVKPVAKQLGVSRAAVYRRIKSSPLYRLASTLSPQEIQSALDEFSGDSAAVSRHLRVPLNTLRSRMRNFSL
ncbi:sigma 54-interacting transcriptional regulator [Candidatus Marimicrobium litorale]|uniref:Sigma-54-dependent Fis family transcriptional regulator n=1 Tax=Candidatus Marimicrobium litorale TaxID=2518991 RepID=A0ABT3T626_9GAMM|nr:sigma 54-interacting transcriptional regulator [Candidatus Marimicrobium litorale]MCX2977266.1 sigma-54-dependent Fis family transcriptional regulator [Candidatus Marimicrobium litorale]